MSDSGVGIYIVDAFTDKPFAGNPAAVCLLPEPKADNWMQSVASEMNLSETAFLTPCETKNHFNLRWFTPTVEVELCGHATLAAAHVLSSCSIVDKQQAIVFTTLSGNLTATNTSDGRISLDFPVVECYDFSPPMELILALGGISPKTSQRNRLDGALIELESEDEVCMLSPSLSDIASIAAVKSVMVTARADRANSPRYDFVSRFFAPSKGVDEDPVTGSAHCSLGPFWTSRLGKNPVIGYQASKRGGLVTVELQGNRVILTGNAVIIVKGQLLAL